ncbi:hypothetical protein BD31_I0819 [Candidatus Nitrosopumilus salaria BD31]|uniref:Uncharacterized protein n=1 Tax=Candidatus Nitrosopumilus salarius BD31 TaxID=859350 RepID=I3D229_9ARCH|nr:hypothetical protein [Candidatus Nitrosopumilus salaria]EIJ65772.1 hypothetical protein BD31_I0819 [Candidatus Nitrosopumilus salaria BD31]
MKTKLLIIIGIVLVAVFGIFIVYPNLILHLMYSDQYMLETAMSSDIVKSFDKMYPENKIRYVQALEQEPAIVFEMVHDQKMAFLAVGNFQEDHLAFMYHCSSFDYRTTFF